MNLHHPMSFPACVPPNLWADAILQAWLMHQITDEEFAELSDLAFEGFGRG